MEIQKLKQLLEGHIAARDYLSIYKQGEDQPSPCIPLAVSETLVLALSFRDLCPDGYVVIPLDRLTSIGHSETDVFFGDIVKKEGALRLMDAAPGIDLADWPSALRSVKETGEIAILDHGDEGYLDVGKIVDVTPDGVAMRRFDTLGVWDEENTLVLYDSVTAVELRSHYINTFSKYLPPIEC